MGIKFTRAGLIYILLTIFMGFSAINTNNNLVFLVVSFMLAIMGISGFLGKGNIEKLKFRVYPSEDIHAKRDAKFTLEVINEKRFFPAILLKLKILDNETDILMIHSSSLVKKDLILRFSKRGRFSIDNIVVSSPFPFNFFIRFKTYRLKEEIIVFPEIGEQSLLNKISQEGSSTISNNEKITLKLEELSNIRSYSNDPAKRIFWKQFAKTGELYTKEYTGEDTISFTIDFQDLLNLYPLEEAIKIATKTIIDASIRSIELNFIISDKKYRIRNLSEKRSALKELALYGD